MPNAIDIIRTLNAVDANCGMSSTITFGDDTYTCEKTVWAEKLFPRKIKDYVFSVLITGTMTTRPAIGDKITFEGRQLIVRGIDEAVTETRLHLGKSYDENAT